MNYVKPHKKVSKEVMAKDFQVLLDAYQPMVELCNRPRGRYQSAYGIAHCQVEAENPLRFFILKDGAMIVNPIITRHTEVPVPHREACMSFPDKPFITVPRFNKCEVEYMTVVEGKPSRLIHENLSGNMSRTMQHLIDLMDAKTIYDV